MDRHKHNEMFIDVHACPVFIVVLGDQESIFRYLMSDFFMTHSGFAIKIFCNFMTVKAKLRLY